MQNFIKTYFWPTVGLIAVVLSFYLLYKELRTTSPSEVMAALRGISAKQLIFAALSTLAAYAALAWYDRIALLHLGIKHISWLFISACSFTTYALSHNIGASVFSGALVRYRAYTSKGLTVAQVAVLVALCSFTFGLGTILLAGLVLVFEPKELARIGKLLPDLLTNETSARTIGFAMLGFVALYIAGSLLRFKPLTIRKFHLEYPRPEIMARQLVAAPLELLGAAGIIYFALPEVGNPGFFVVVAIFLASFSAGLVSNAPGGLGVFELVFLTAMPELPKADVLAALLVFRLFYLIIPLLMAIPVVLAFERSRLKAVAPEVPPHEDAPLL